MEKSDKTDYIFWTIQPFQGSRRLMIRMNRTPKHLFCRVRRIYSAIFVAREQIQQRLWESQDLILDVFQRLKEVFTLWVFFCCVKHV